MLPSYLRSAFAKSQLIEFIPWLNPTLAQFLLLWYWSNCPEIFSTESETEIQAVTTFVAVVVVACLCHFFATCPDLEPGNYFKNFIENKTNRKTKYQSRSDLAANDRNGWGLLYKNYRTYQSLATLFGQSYQPSKKFQQQLVESSSIAEPPGIFFTGTGSDSGSYKKIGF